ncbi:DUF488 domain-containing protein [Lentzea californiensis]|uniref:DUF488 domain-containing protein n=1 Tax=Lentzea californiensis TaxID=438851 RepID=UPI00216561E6|nr:DUF488 domain-containing protein [Lentzea californiensis]MCR3750464.1 Protein of unknown function, DUF488 [Lentzea californiensis]
MRGTAPGIVGTGYEGVDLDAFLTRLGEERIDVLVDVRLTPISRKRGFSKTTLSNAVTSADVGYLHLRDLGNPKTNRAGFGGTLQELAEVRDRYAALLTDEAAEAALDQLVELAKCSAIGAEHVDLADIPVDLLLLVRRPPRMGSRSMPWTEAGRTAANERAGGRALTAFSTSHIDSAMYGSTIGRRRFHGLR